MEIFVIIVAMKKLILLIVIAIIGLGFYFSANKTEINPEDTAAVNSFKPDPGSATFTFDEGAVTLSNGKSDEDGEQVELLEQKASGDLNKDGKEDTAVLLASSGGGSGVFIYVAAYVSGPVNYKGTNAIFVGDRISPESLSISNGVIIFNYLDREADEPFGAEPTVLTSKQFVYANGAIEEK